MLRAGVGRSSTRRARKLMADGITPTRLAGAAGHQDRSAAVVLTIKTVPTLIKGTQAAQAGAANRTDMAPMRTCCKAFQAGSGSMQVQP
jgi:hypothetical protein